MNSSLCIEIIDDDEVYVQATVIKARRRWAHICLAIQQTGIFLISCLIIYVVASSLYSEDTRDRGNIGPVVLVTVISLLVFSLMSDISYEYYQYGGVHDHEYDIRCGQYFSWPTPWLIKWCIRKGKNLFKS